MNVLDFANFSKLPLPIQEIALFVVSFFGIVVYLVAKIERMAGFHSKTVKEISDKFVEHLSQRDERVERHQKEISLLLKQIRDEIVEHLNDLYKRAQEEFGKHSPQGRGRKNKKNT